VSTFDALRSWLVVEVADGFGAATLAGKILADAGCTVARIEPPGTADTGETRHEREVFDLVSRGKSSVVIDWERSDALHAMLAAARIAIVDRPGLLRLREALACKTPGERYPRLTVCACTPFGLEGPMAAWTGGEEIVQAVAGIMSITGHPGSGPTRVAGIPFTYAAAMFAVTSSFADAVRVEREGKAALLDVAVYDAAIAFESASLPAYFLSGVAPEGIGNRHSMSVPWNSFRCRDGWVIVCGGNHPNWVRICEMIGRPEMVADPRFATQDGRIVHVDEIEAAIGAWMRERDVAEVEALLNANSIAGGSVLPLRDVLDHAQFGERNLITADGRQAGALFHVDREPLDVREAAWGRGAGTRAILVHRCGVPLAQYERWRDEGRVAEDRGVTGVATA
jgi:formyl-CoA transferase/CoA:oxalate CoA-transferase